MPIVGLLWGISGIAAWIYMIIECNLITRICDKLPFVVLIIFLLIGPFAWFPAVVFKELHKSE